jgi:hypothetical protein
MRPHHPSTTIHRGLLPAVIWLRSARRHPQTVQRQRLNIAQCVIGLEPVDRQLGLMMTGPIAFASVISIDKQLGNSVGAE